MKQYKNIILVAFFALLLQNTPGFSQQPEGSKKLPTKEEVLNMSYDDLLNMPFEDLIKLANIVGVSAEDLLQMILNKQVSSASKSNETVFQSPLSTTVVSKEEIQNSGATTIPEVLRLVPGVIVREKTPGNFDVHIRGNDNVPAKNIPVYSENSMTLLVIDGRPVYNYAFGGTFWETLPIGLNDIERIEVIRGASSALYGPNAVTGVINIITKKTTEDKLAINVDAQAGNANSQIGNLSLSFGKGKLKSRISGNYTNLGRFDEKIYSFSDAAYKNVSDINPDNKTIPSEVVPNPGRGVNQYGANMFLFYDVNEKTGADLAFGFQKSDANTNVFGNYNIMMIGHSSQTYYVDFRPKFYGFQAQVNYLFGDQEFERNVQGYHVDISTLNASLDYEYKYKTLTLRPGISYQKCIYDDNDYVNVNNNEGYLNGARNLNTFAYYLRADYRAFNKLRLIAALRGDKYNKPDKNYFTWQFVTSYEINKKNILRAVYSRANRGPFMVNTYSDYQFESNPQTGVNLTLKYLGNGNLKLPQMDMLEVGYRSSLTDRLQVDIEGFYSVISNLSYFNPDSVYFNSASPAGYNFSGTVRYQSFDLKSVQAGVTATINMSVNDKLSFSIFGTYQESTLKNFYNKTATKIIKEMLGKALVSGKAQADGIDSLINMTNKSTPSFYGGGNINYIPCKKLIVNAGFYYYSQQTYTMKDYETDIDPKFIVNLKVSYKFWKNNSVYVNARNLFNNESREFGYLDKIGGTYLMGINLNF
jgi:iron complex outermembrane recepter protein